MQIKISCRYIQVWVVNFESKENNPQKPVLPFLTPTAPKRFTSAQEPNLIRNTASFTHGARES